MKKTMLILGMLSIVSTFAVSANAATINLSKCHYWINDTKQEGDLDMVKGGANQVIDATRSVRFTLYYMDVANNKTEIEGRIIGPCTAQEAKNAEKSGWGCAGHTFAQSIVETTTPISSLNVGGENFIVKCTAE